MQDDWAVTEIYKLKLELDGYLVTVADPDQADVAAQRCAPDIIYMHVRDANPQAAVLLHRLHSSGSTRNIPVVIVTVHDAEVLKTHGFELGLLDYLVKADAGPPFLPGSRRQAGPASQRYEA